MTGVIRSFGLGVEGVPFHVVRAARLFPAATATTSRALATSAHEKRNAAGDRHNSGDRRKREGPLAVRRRVNRTEINDCLAARI
jgi:hypothetical protein